MGLFILRRLGVMILTALCLTFIVFFLTNLTPNLEKLAKTVDGIGPWVNRLYKLRKRDGRISDSGLVSRAHAQGLVVHPYTYRSDALPRGFGEFRELLRFTIEELAIDGLFTDFPDAAVRYLQSRHGVIIPRET